MGVENLCKRRSSAFNLAWPSGPDFHSRVLDDFLRHPTLGAALSREAQERLKRYLKFRHRSVHGYGFEVSWEKVEEPLRLLPETVDLLSDIWTKWLETPS